MDSLFESMPKIGQKYEVPEAKYTLFGEKIRQTIPGSMQCSMACGGRNCKWENPSKWSDEDQVIKGVFSSWVLNDVVAMSRPSTEVILKYDMIKQFKESNICSIINLQRPGEHASCGPPLHKESQFTYEPKTFMDNDIFFYNFGWRDYGVASLNTILDMVKVMSFALSEGKVAVHCHAGLGRTGVLIACYLVYAYRMDAASAINTVRKRRPNSIQTRGQIACIQEFAQFLKPLRIVFPQVAPHAERLTLVQFLHRQRHLLHGFESRALRHTPKVVHVVCQRLSEIATMSEDIAFYDMRTRSNTGPNLRSGKRSRKGTLQRSNTVDTMKDTIPGAFVNEHSSSEEQKRSATASPKIDALLSPRLSRRTESAKSRASSSSKSVSGPGSPIPFMHPEYDNKAYSDESATGQAPELMESEPEEINSANFGGAKVVMVKQGSRSALLPSATIISQTPGNADGNLNNNNQSLPKFGHSPTKNEGQENVQISYTIYNNSSKAISSVTDEASIAQKPPENLVSLPSPTPSDHEPELAIQDSKCAGDEKQHNKKGAGECGRPQPQSYRFSAGQSQKVLPTGMPARTRVGSGKDKKKTLLPEDNFVDEGSRDVIEAKEAMPEQLKDESAVITSLSLEAGKGAESGDSAEGSLEEPQAAAIQNSVDHELDEIIEIDDADGPFLSDSDGESDSAKSNKDDFLTHSVASKISWVEQLDSEGINVVHEHIKSNESNAAPDDEFHGPDSELVIPAGTLDEESDIKTHTPLLLGATSDSDHLNELSIKTTSLEDEQNSSHGEDESVIASGLPSSEPTRLTKPSRSPRRPKSASYLKRLSEKSRRAKSLPVHGLTQSLCDLRKYDDIADDGLTPFGPDVSPGYIVPLSPISKCSSSDDVRTPTTSASKRRIKDPITVAMALAYKLTDNEWLWEKVYTKQVELNTREDAWSGLERESDAHILSCVMWSWIEHLSEPILTMSEVDTLVRMSRPEDEASVATKECPDPALFQIALASLGKPICSTFQCILHCLLSLPPLSYELEVSVTRRVVSAFTQFHLFDDAGELSEDRKKIDQLIGVLQNYLVKTRAREQQSSAGQSSRKVSTSSKAAVKLSDKENPSCNSSVNESHSENAACIESSFSLEVGDSNSPSNVVELPQRIAVL